MSPVRTITALLALGGAIVAVPPAPAAVDPARVREAIDRGAEFLRKSRGTGGSDHPVGRAALTGMAMLEGRVPPSDPAIADVAKVVRGGAATENQTYDIALAILFLDRLGDPADIPTIQLLGVRLYAGLTANGGWTYNCGDSVPLPAPGPGGMGQSTLTGQPAGEPAPQPEKRKKDDGFPQVAKKANPAAPAEPQIGRLSDAAARYFLGVRQALRSAGRPGGDGDNSNTQFGLIGLWVASRHGVPADDAFALIERRFLTTQNRADAGWSYSSGGGSTAAMTCAGLLGLAVGGGRGQGQVPQAAPKSEPAKRADDPFFSPPKKDNAAANSGLPGLTGPPAKKAAVAAALGSLGAVLARARQGGTIDQGAGNQFYLLWSLERVGVAYGLTTIGNVDWYDWGAGILLAPGAQAADGSWTGSGGGYGPDVDTSFAILFLAKSNFTRDLSSKLTGQVNDPGTSELRGGGDIPLFGGATGKKPAPDAAANPGVKPDAVAGNPPPAPPPGNSPADQIAEALLTAGAEWPTRLEVARDTKGADYTAGLVKAIPLLTGEKQKQARDALAERLTRMTAATLRTMMKDADPELRRGAVLAAAMKDDKAHVPDLIERVGGDSADVVVRAARAGLKSLTGQDFGPAPGADAAARAKAAADWKKWHASHGK